MALLPSNLCDLFTQAVNRCPENLAVDHNEGVLTYRDLEDASNSLARALISLNVGKQSPVVLLTAHGTFNIIATLAILKAGGCCVPIDRATWSSEMIGYVCNTVDSKVILNTTSEPFSAPDGAWHVLHYTKALGEASGERTSNCAYATLAPSDPAYIIFTSGSTGKPKGVVISHKSLCLYSKTSPVNLDIVPGDRFLHTLSVAFDACACMLFSVLGNCGTVVPAQAEDFFLQAHSCNVLAATPAMLKNLPLPTTKTSIFSNLERIVLGGETAAPDLLGAWIDAGVQVSTAYGVTETTSMGSIHLVERDPQTGNINPFILGRGLQQSPMWVVDPEFGIINEENCEGEIIIGGDGVAEGYYKDEEKTLNHFTQWNGGRSYRTGDFGCWIKDSAGNKVIEFRGRKDRTVKNRGFLVNLDRDVEGGLYRIGKVFGLTSVCAAATENGIIAVVTPSGVDTATLIAKAKETMCSYYIPYRIGSVDSLPLSPNGKVQHKQLADLIKAIDHGEKPTRGSITEQPFLHPETTICESLGGGHYLDILLKEAQQVLALPGEKSRKLHPSDSFVALGGSSLSVFKLVSVLGQHSLHIPAKELFKCQPLSEAARSVTPTLHHPGLSMTSSMESEGTQQAISQLRNQAIKTLGLVQGSFDIGPLTSLQLDLALPTLGDESININQVKIAYTGTPAGMMERAWQALWQSEPVFRSEISLMIGCGALIIHHKPFRKPKIASHSCDDAYKAAIEDVSMEVGLGCTLDFIKYHMASDEKSNSQTSSSYRGSILKADEITIVLTVHHSLMDGESLRLLLDKVERLALGFSLPPSTSPIHANYELMNIQRTRDTEVRSFFSDYLGQHPSNDATTTKIPAPGDQSARKTAFFETSVSIREVTDFAHQNCASAACIYYMAWAMAISAIESNPNVIVGAVASNRAALRQYDGAIGAYMSTLPLVFKFNPASTIADLISKTMDDLATVGEYAWARSDQVNVGRRMRNLLSMQFALPDENSKPPASWTDSAENSEFPLCLLVESSGDFRLLYDAAQFNGEFVQRLGQYFKHALYSLHHEALVSGCMAVNSLQETLFKQAELYRLRSSERTMKQVLEQAMDRFPDLIAVEDCVGGKLTYRELDQLTNIVAHCINTYVPEAEVIALYSDGSIKWIVGLIGTIKAGCAYVSLDPRSSMARRKVTCEQSSATAVLLPNASQASQAPSLDGLRVFAIDDMLTDAAGNKSMQRPPNRVSLDSALLIVFTSGTTGNPKGMLISNRAFVAMETSYGTTMFAAPGRRISQFMSPVFDVCNMEIFSALLHGATLVLRDPSDPYANLSRVNTAAMTPSVLSVLDLDDYPNLELIYACGEPVSEALVKKFAPRVLLYNAYGPAECCVLTGIDRLIPGDRITVGKPMNTVRVYILDEKQCPVAPGARGEVFVAGVQVLRDYINAPEQGARNILPDPWHPGERMYRSGDSGSINRDGRLALYGRMDRLVKLRGFRVELAGVEQAITSGPADEGISHCAVIVVKGSLIAYVSFDTSQRVGNLSKDDRIDRLRGRLQDQLLASSVPHDIVPLDSFPLTCNGKVDTGALEVYYCSHLNVTVEGVSSQEPSTLQNGIVHKLADEWCQVLQLSTETQFQESSDFFKLGGHSVSIMLLATRLTTAFGKKITVRELLPCPNFKDQVEMIKRLLEVDQSPHDDEVQMATSAPLRTEELTEIEKQVWFQNQVATTVTAFNIIRVLQLDGEIDIDKLSHSLNAVLAMDPIFRSNIVERSSGPIRILRDSTPVVQEIDDLDMDQVVNHRFDLARDALIQVYLIRHSPERGEQNSVTLVILTSHVIADLGSLQNFLRLTSLAYSGSILTPLDRPKHLDSNLWSRQRSTAEQRFWTKYLEGHSYSDNRLPLLHRSSDTLPLATFQGTSRTLDFQGELVVTLNSLVRRLGITHHQMALAAAALLLQWFSAEDDFILGAPNSGRTTLDEQEALGQFLDRLPVRVTKKDFGMETDTDTTTSVLTRVRDSSLRALSNAIPFNTIVQALGFPSGGLQHPLFECMVTFHPRSAGLDNYLQLPGCKVTVSTPFPQGAKFPLMLEWFEVTPDQWSLHIEHDTCYLPPTTIDMMIRALDTILRSIADECPMNELHERLAALDSTALDVESSASSSSRVSSNRSVGHSQSVEEIALSIQEEMQASLGTGSGTLSPNTSFFSAGADSEAVVTLRHRMQKLGLDIPVRSIFLAQSPTKLAEHVLLIND